MAGRWTLTRLLGVGGAACVYEARHRDGRLAALKILHPALSCRQLARRRIVSEGYAANKVGHPGVVRVLDHGEDGDLIFLVMELLRGRSLAERLAEEGPMAPGEVVRIAAALLDVLALAHERGVVHRDIKPSNVFQLDDGTIKVLDFGIAHVRELDSTEISESGVMFGTPSFMAPEQAGGRTEEVDALTDLWAVGATMFRVLSGRFVHQAKTPNAVVVASATQPAVPIRRIRPDLPPDIAAVVDRALAFERNDRFPNARIMQRALLEPTHEKPRPRRNEPPTIPDFGFGRRGISKRIVRAAAAILGGLVLLASSLMAWRIASDLSPAATIAPEPIPIGH